MGKVTGSEIDSVQGYKEIDGILLSAEVVTAGIELGLGYFVKRQ